MRHSLSKTRLCAIYKTAPVAVFRGCFIDCTYLTFPTGNLDSKTSQDVLGLLKVTGQKFAQTIVMITHNEEIAQLADRIIRIEDGKIVERM